MAIKIKAQEKKLMVGPKMGTYVYQMSAETYSALTESKMIDEAALRSGIQRGALYASFDAIGAVIKAWATEGHSVPVPGLGTMRFSVNAKTVEDVNMVASTLISTRKIIFTPSTDVKKALQDATISITCYDRNGNVVKRVNSQDPGEIDNAAKFLLSVVSGNEAYGTVSGGGTYAAGTEVELVATAKSGYKFTKWSDGDTNATRTYTTIGEAVTLTAEFISNDEEEGGAVGE
ncbi:MAG: DNA-binding protein [Prevotellaceae bacterium]|nr:DNA-binding protein [Prevotellaceae bacterium]